MLGNHTNWGDSGAGRGCYNRKSRCNALVSALKNALLAFGVVLLVSAACIGSAKATTTTVYVTSGDDDAHEDGFGIDSTDIYVTVARGESSYSSAGFRLASIGVPKGAKINSATFYAYSNYSLNDPYCNIYAEATDSSYNFVDYPTVISRPRTTAYTTVGAENIGTGYKSYNVTAVIQEMVYRPGWVNGNPLSILMIGAESDTSKYATFYTYEYSSGSAKAYIIIDWSPGQTILNQAHYRWRNDDGVETGTVAVGAVSTYSTTGVNKVTSATISHTVSGNNRLLLVGVTLWPGAGNYVTSVTWNGTSLTKITDVSNSTSIRTELWKLVAPATGTANVVVNVTGSPNQTPISRQASFHSPGWTSPLPTEQRSQRQEAARPPASPSDRPAVRWCSP